MKRLKHNFKKGMAFVLSLAMVAGLVPAMSGGANKVQAADNPGTEPSVSAYATKEQLMTAFTPDSDGNATTIGKLVFGKNSSGASQEWYILGRDGGVPVDDNTIIFAASPIATGQKFEDDEWNNKTDSSLWSDCNYSDESITEVYPNHYGASDLRVALQGMATNTSYFTTAEQGLMNATTVTTHDTRFPDYTYTTTDKLYALAADGADPSYNTIKAGSGDSTVLAMSSYWSNGSRFWLRSPFDGNRTNVLLANPKIQSVGPAGVNTVNYEIEVQPASNLNLSSVLFASSAKAASSDTAESGTIADGTAMTLRLNGTGKDIGTVTYNTTTGDIKATKGSTSQTVALIVQGKGTVNGEEKDWYYSKQITGTEVVNVTDIVSETTTPASIDLSTCKIWLETTDSTENLTYAVEATETTIIIIHSVAFTDIETPVPNTSLDTGASCVTTGVSSTTPQITWTPSDSTATYNTSYTASITLTAGTGYEFIDSTTATVSGNDATGVTRNADGTLTVTYAFPATPNNTYQIIDGANSSWTHDSDGNITIRGNGDFSKFTGVKVDGNLIDKSNYTAKEGSTIITLKASYLNTLSAGTHTVEILWTDGSASTTFTIKANTSDNSNNNQNDNNNSDSSDDKPSSGTDKKGDGHKTGDNTPIVWLFILSILSGTGLILTAKKRRKNLNS